MWEMANNELTQMNCAIVHIHSPEKLELPCILQPMNEGKDEHMHRMQ